MDLETSLAEWKEVAKEPNYKGDMPDSATMNIWLPKQAMKKLSKNGGKMLVELKN